MKLKLVDFVNLKMHLAGGPLPHLASLPGHTSCPCSSNQTANYFIVFGVGELLSSCSVTVLELVLPVSVSASWSETSVEVG